MNSFRRGRDLIAALVVSAVLWSTSLFAQSQPSTSIDQSNRIFITYVPPESSELRELYEFLRAHRALERIQEILSPFRSPEELTIKTAGISSWGQISHSDLTVWSEGASDGRQGSAGEH